MNQKEFKTEKMLINTFAAILKEINTAFKRQKFQNIRSSVQFGMY